METSYFFLQFLSSTSLLLTVIFLLLISYVSSSSFSTRGDSKGPPGPRGLPLLGNMLQMDFRQPYKTLIEFSKQYGSVYSIRLAHQKVVVLSGYKTVKNALVKYAEEFGDRHQALLMHESNQGHGIIWSNGDTWRDMRRFALKNLRDFGMGKTIFEDKIIEECDHLIKEFKKSEGKPYHVNDPLIFTTSNVISSLVYGKRFEYDDTKFVSLIHCTSRRTEIMLSRSAQIFNVLPWIGRFIPNRKEFREIGDVSVKHNIEMFRRLKETLNPEMCRGFVDAFLVQKEKHEESGITNSNFTDENLMKSVINMFAAGSESTSATLAWGLMLMAKYPEIQHQVREELSRVVGNRQVRINDRMNLPLTNAVIHEIQRVASIAPMGLPHQVNKDFTFQGHFIEKGTVVHALLRTVLHDENEWEKPESFHPAHFLDKDGQFVMRDAFLPFSAGRRACIGETLVKMELFIILSSLLQKFHFSPPPEVQMENPYNLQLMCEPLF
ncbi:cytochrome P450 2K1-like [Paralichthys olivaceus]|uniref:cytochrome P450 2K1-like n=1 Tax=Paralichthys olivaceus TaxID=8255 RepID=UPI003751C3E6